MKLTEKQKLEAVAYRFYQHGEWLPKAGDIYTTTRADLEAYEVVFSDESVVKTRYTEGSEEVSEWPTEEFQTEGFGPNRLWVPPWVLE